MPADLVRGIIAFVGIAVQLGGSVFLAGLFVLLQRNASRRRYFAIWTQAWLAAALAMLALALRFAIVPGFDDRLLSDDPADAQFLYTVYQFAKLLYFGLLMTGALHYVKGLTSPAFVPTMMAAAALYAIVSVTTSVEPREIVVWQGPVAVGSLLYSAARLLRLSPSRQSLGSKITAAVFVMTAALWALYLSAFLHTELASSEESHPLVTLLFYSSYLDVLLQALLGYGMVLLLMEDTKREVDDAHAELEVAHSQLRRDTLYDPLTGALNRRAFMEGVGLESAKASFGAVVVLDLDNLKIVNDTHGHSVGDELLKHLVEALRGTLRPSDRVYRWGGDEFLLVLPGARPSAMLPRIEAAIGAAPPLHVQGVPEGVRVLVSLGGAEYAGAEELAPAIADADTAMYWQKQKRKSGEQARVLPVA